VPTESEPSMTRTAPTQRTSAVEATPTNWISGPEIACTVAVAMLASRFWRFRSTNLADCSFSRANALATRAPVMFSARTALMPEIFSWTVT